MKISKTVKTLISSVVALVMLFSLSVPFAFAATETEFSTTSNALEAYDFLKAVGAMDPDEVAFSADMAITRAHFVKLALHLSNDAPNVLVSNDEVFSDVTPSTQYENYIETAYRIGYISGSTSSMFEPQQNITLAQAIKIICNVLGYQKYAEVNGGFPGGYLIMAQRLDLLEGLTIADNQELDMANAMILLRNASETKLMQITGFGDELKMETVGDETLLTESHDILSEKGIITANSYTELFSQESELEKNQICVNNVIFNVSQTDAQEYLGYDVRVYYKNDESKNVKDVVHIELSEENTIITATSEDLEVEDDRIICTFDDESTKSLKLSPKVTYIFNGKMTIMSPEDLLDVDKGLIELVSNDDNRIIDVVKVKKYETLLISGISASSGIVIANDGSRIEFDPDSEDYTFSITKNGQPVSLDSLKQNDVLLVSEGIGSGLCHIEIIASNKTLSGKFEEIGDDYVIIGGATYDLDTALNDKIVLGKEYTVYIDAFGSVAHVAVDNDIVYGYLYGIIKSGMNMPQCRIFTENNRWVDLYFAKKVKYNGGTVDAETLFNTLTKDNSFRQLIRYNVNDNREIVRLETAEEHLIGSINEKEAVENDIFRISYSGSGQYRNSAKSIDAKVFIDANAKVFNVPANMNRDEFKVKSASVFVADRSYTLTAYDADKYLSAKAIVTAGVSNDLEINSADKFMVVKGIGQVLNSDGEVVPSIKGYWNDMEISFPVIVGDDGVSVEAFNALKKGDVILFKYDEDSNIVNLKEYSLEDKSLTSQLAYYGNTTGIIVCGKVDEIDTLGRKIRMTSADDSSAEHRGVIYSNSTSCAIWEGENESYRTAEITEILPGDIIFANMRYFQCTDVLIVRK